MARMLSRLVMLAATADGRAAAGNAAAGHADAEAVFVGDFLGGGFGGVLVQVDGDDVRAFLDQAHARLRLPMPLPAPTTAMTCRASSFSAGMRLSLASSSSQYSMSKASCCGRAIYSIDRLRAAHHFDGAVVEFGGDARFALVLAPGDHAEAGDEDDGGVGVAHRRASSACLHFS